MTSIEQEFVDNIKKNLGSMEKLLRTIAQVLIEKNNLLNTLQNNLEYIKEQNNQILEFQNLQKRAFVVLIKQTQTNPPIDSLENIQKSIEELKQIMLS